MVYNFNLGIGWASSGVEYAQSYRNKAFQQEGIPAKFIYIDMFPRENLIHMTRNLGFADQDIIWLYTFFTDFKMAPTTYWRKDFEGTFSEDYQDYVRDGKIGKYLFANGDFYTVYFTTEASEFIHRVEYVSQGKLLRKDYFTYGRIYTEYYAPSGKKAHLYHRRFYNEDGTTAYEEIIDGEDVMYQFPDKILFSKEELVGYMVDSIDFQKEDVVLIDRTTGIGQAILEHVKNARVGIIIHADHYSKSFVGDTHILWNNYYEYAFAMHKHVDFYVVATDSQKEMLEQQFQKYVGVKPQVYTIPVGSLEYLEKPDETRKRKPYSMLTASRLAVEKHVDWTIKACVRAKAEIPQLTFDIYGEGGEKQRLAALIRELDAEDYIHLKGQQDLRHVYQQYELYFSASLSEGFGLSLLEAVGGGDAMIGFQVMYGNTTFILDGENGYFVPSEEEMSEMDRVNGFAEKLIQYFRDENRQRFEEASYGLARKFLIGEVSSRWKELVH